MKLRGTTMLVVTIASLIVVLLSVWIAVGYLSVAGIESPAYEVIEERDLYEIRRYAPHIVAEVSVPGPYDEAMNRGFRKLADFIFGNNTAPSASQSGAASKKIAMTAPVLEQRSESSKIAMTAPVLDRPEADQGMHIVSFVMPSEYSMETLPKPNNDEIRLVEIPESTYAILKFSSYATEKKTRSLKERLIDALANDRVKAVGEPLVAQYNPPWTPPFMRRNEIWQEIDFD